MIKPPETKGRSFVVSEAATFLNIVEPDGQMCQADCNMGNNPIEMRVDGAEFKDHYRAGC